MKCIITTGASALLLGCTHLPALRTPVHHSGSVTEARANAIAQAAAAAGENWKRVDGVARKIDGGWAVLVCPVPTPDAGTYVLVTLDASGQVTKYEKQKYEP